MWRNGGKKESEKRETIGREGVEERMVVRRGRGRWTERRHRDREIVRMRENNIFSCRLRIFHNFHSYIDVTIAACLQIVHGQTARSHKQQSHQGTSSLQRWNCVQACLAKWYELWSSSSFRSVLLCPVYHAIPPLWRFQQPAPLKLSCP